MAVDPGVNGNILGSSLLNHGGGGLSLISGPSDDVWSFSSWWHRGEEKLTSSRERAGKGRLSLDGKFVGRSVGRWVRLGLLSTTASTENEDLRL